MGFRVSALGYRIQGAVEGLGFKRCLGCLLSS